MEVTALCSILMVNVLFLLRARAQNSSYYIKKADAAFVRVDPDRLQFFEYESISFSCGGSSGWRVMKKVSSDSSQWDTSAASLDISPAFVSHSGEYFCGNGDGERSAAVNVSVTAGDVVPAVPVREGQTVTLRCRKKATSESFPADFYKDGKLFKTGYTSNMVLQNVSSSSEGLYSCSIPAAGSSAESRLAVREYSGPQETTPEEDQESSPDPPDPPEPGSSQLSILIPAILSSVCVAVLLLGILIICCRKHKAFFSTVTPTTASDPVYEEASTAEPQVATYAIVTKHKKKREKVSGDSDGADPMYAAINKERTEKDINESFTSSAFYTLSTGPTASSSAASQVLSASLYHTID